MSTDRETTRVVRSWLVEGVTRLPDRVVDAVLDQLPATPQRRSWWPPRRFADVNRYTQAAIAVATVLVVAVIGYSLLPGSAMPPGGQPTPTPQPTEVPRIPASGAIEPGMYRMGIGPFFLVTVPPGWESVSGGMGLRKHADQPNEAALNTYSAHLRVYADACESEGMERAIGPTTADLVAALRTQKNLVVDDVVDVTIAGLPGVRIEMSAPAGLDVATCSNLDLQIWRDQDGGGDWLAGLGAPCCMSVLAWAADGPGGRLAYVRSAPGATSADIAELDAIIASIRFIESAPAPS